MTLHPDFGSGEYDGQSIGIPYQIEAGTQAMVPVKLTEYASESDPGPMPIPANALIEGYPIRAMATGTCWFSTRAIAGFTSCTTLT